MAKLITRDFDGKKVNFYFGTRVFALMESEMGIQDLSQFGERFERPKFSDIATMLYLAHENASFFFKQSPEFCSVDEIYSLIDEVGLEDAQAILTEGITSLLKVNDTAKKKTRAKP
jgi:hypothetical protein